MTHAALEMVVSFDDPENYTGLDLSYKLADQYNNILEAKSRSGVYPFCTSASNSSR
jgi:hypothetical protein